MKSIYILLAEGFELIEAMSTIDVMHRADVETRLVHVLPEKKVTSSHSLASLDTSLSIDQVNIDADAIMLPGGFPGYETLRTTPKVLEIVRQYDKAGKIIAAICGAPSVLPAAGIKPHSKLTAHHSVHPLLKDYDIQTSAVVRDGNIITGAGAGQSINFAMALLEALVDEKQVKQVAYGMEIR
ncbi:MAG: DJ-1/PfpI family protein [Alistipes sp.]|nr:DJ-1/PfpI family protein [Candidatus Alistipes equi]